MLYSHHEINERDTSKLLEVLDGSLTVVVVMVCGGGGSMHMSKLILLNICIKYVQCFMYQLYFNKAV